MPGDSADSACGSNHPTAGFRLTQRCSQRAQRPTRRAITRALRRPGNLGEDTALLDLTLAERLAAAMAQHDCGQPGMVETRHPTRHGVADAAADKLRCRRVIRIPGKIGSFLR